MSSHFMLVLLTTAAAVLPLAAAQQSPVSPYSSDFNPSMAIVIVILVCALFFTGFFSMYIRQCAEVTVGSGMPGDAAAALFRRSPGGLDPEVIESFPMFRYSEVKDHKIGKGALECAVCISEFEDDETLRLLPKCDHVFHPECIGGWLVSHTTCPVCRADLVPKPDEQSGDTAQRNESNHSAGEQNSRSERISDVQNQNQVSITIEGDGTRDPQLIDTPEQNLQRVTKLPRSHSTGHSLVQPGECCERFTLRLPEEVRRQIMIQRLKRTTSCVFVFPTEGSSRRGYRSGGEGSNRGRQVWRSDRDVRLDRWFFTVTPPFISKTRSVRSPKVGNDGDVTVVAPSK